jgi:hypothetical protein
LVRRLTAIHHAASEASMSALSAKWNQNQNTPLS